MLVVSLSLDRSNTWCEFLEPVSKPPQRNQRRCEVEKRQIHRREAFVSNQQATIVTEPREGAFNDPPMTIAPKATPVIIPAAEVPVPIRDDGCDPSSAQLIAQRVTVVPTVGDQARRLLPRSPRPASRDADGVQRRIDEFDFRRTGRGDMNSQRNTLAVDHHHPLRTLSAGRSADFGAPFFAEANDPSMNVFSHRNRPRASSWPRKARHSRSHVPSTSHARSRRQHVDPLGYPSGRSRQRAPVFKTQRMPSTAARSVTRGRPPVLDRRVRGRCGSILVHCASVNRTLRLATSTSGQCRTAACKKVQELSASSTTF